MKVYCDIHTCTDSKPMYCPECVKTREKFVANSCTKCTVKPIVKEHMCEKCYTEHCQWLRNQSKSIRTRDYLAKNHKWHTVEDLEKAMDSDQWYTLYESKA